MKIGFYYEDLSLKLLDKICLLDQEYTKIQIPEPYCGFKAILLNYDDKAYGLFKIDKNSLKFFEEHLSKISDKQQKRIIL